MGKMDAQAWNVLAQSLANYASTIYNPNPGANEGFRAMAKTHGGVIAAEARKKAEKKAKEDAKKEKMARMVGKVVETGVNFIPVVGPFVAPLAGEGAADLAGAQNVNYGAAAGRGITGGFTGGGFMGGAGGMGSIPGMGGGGFMGGAGGMGSIPGMGGGGGMGAAGGAAMGGGGSPMDAFPTGGQLQLGGAGAAPADAIPTGGQLQLGSGTTPEMRQQMVAEEQAYTGMSADGQMVVPQAELDARLANVDQGAMDQPVVYDQSLMNPHGSAGTNGEGDPFSGMGIAPEQVLGNYADVGSKYTPPTAQDYMPVSLPQQQPSYDPNAYAQNQPIANAYSALHGAPPQALMAQSMTPQQNYVREMTVADIRNMDTGGREQFADYAFQANQPMTQDQVKGYGLRERRQLRRSGYGSVMPKTRAGVTAQNMFQSGAGNVWGLRGTMTPMGGNNFRYDSAWGGGF